MKTKHIIVILMTFIVFAFCSCSTSETNNTQYSDPLFFNSVDELKEYLTSDTHMVNMFSESRNGESVIYVPSQAPFNSELNYVELVGSHIYYEYTFGTPSGNSKKAPGNSNTLENSKEPSSEANEVANSIESQIEEAGGYDKYIEQNGLQKGDQEIIHNLKNSTSIGWNFTADGQTYLTKLISMNPDIIFEFDNHPGYYYSEATYPGGDTVYGYMIYWVEDGYYFEAYVPSEYVDQFFKMDMLSLISIE